MNGETVQKSNTSDLIFGVPRLIEFISGIMTLQPGDVIATGTPPEWDSCIGRSGGGGDRGDRRSRDSVVAADRSS